MWSVRCVAVLLAFTAVLCFAAPYAKVDPSARVHRVLHSDAAARQRLADLVLERNLIVDHRITRESTDMYLTPDDVTVLAAAGFSLSPVVDVRSGQNDVLGWPGGVPFYRNYTELEALMQSVAQSCPSITRLYSIGRSVQGRELYVMQMTRNPGPRRRGIPQFKYIANMHGDEVVGREMLLNLIEYMCAEYGRDPLVTVLLNTTDIHIMPSMNPDGFELRTRANANGFDLNRNFPDQFTDPINQVTGRQPEVMFLALPLCYALCVGC